MKENLINTFKAKFAVPSKVNALAAQYVDKLPILSGYDVATVAALVSAGCLGIGFLSVFNDTLDAIQDVRIKKV